MAEADWRGNEDGPTRPAQRPPVYRRLRRGREQEVAHGEVDEHRVASVWAVARAVHLEKLPAGQLRQRGAIAHGDDLIPVDVNDEHRTRRLACELADARLGGW